MPWSHTVFGEKVKARGSVRLTQTRKVALPARKNCCSVLPASGGYIVVNAHLWSMLRTTVRSFGPRQTFCGLVFWFGLITCRHLPLIAAAFSFGALCALLSLLIHFGRRKQESNGDGPAALTDSGLA
jgi:hypothetical protein